MLESLGWSGLVAAGAFLAGAGSWGLRGMGPLQRTIGCAVLAAVTSLGWFTVVQPVMFHPSTETAALGLSLSINVGLMAWVGSGAGSREPHPAWGSGTRQRVGSE